MYTTDKKQIDHNDYWYIKDNPLSKVGVFPYLGRQISDQLEPDKIYQVLRPEEELSNQEFLDSLKLQPFVDDHDMLGTKPGMKLPEEKGIDGTIGADVYYKEGIVYGDIKLYTERIKDEINSGKKEISMGYFCDYELQEGEYGGVPYQAIQRNLRINHVALVDEGRMGADVRVLDHKITFDTIKEIKQMTIKTNKKSLQKSALDEDIEEITKSETDCNATDEDVDKRELIDEIGGILKDKVDEELWRTIVGKMEKLAYNNSEEGANDEHVDEETGEVTGPVENPYKGFAGKIQEKWDDFKVNRAMKKAGKGLGKDEEIMEEPVAQVETVTEAGETEVTVSNGEAEVTVSMDAMIKKIGQRDALVDAVRPLIGDNAKFKMMSTKEVAKYACDKLDLKVSNGQEVSVLRGYIAATKKHENKVTYSLDNAVSLAPAKDEAFERYLNGGNK